jgi:hypothetical protein
MPVVGILALGAVPATAASAGVRTTPVRSGLSAPVPGFTVLDSVACPTAATCVSVGSGGSEDQYGKSAIVTASTGAVKAWTGGLINQMPNAVACPPKATTCLMVADDAIATVNVSTGAMKVTAVPKRPSNGIVALDAIACASPTTCYAVGFEGTEASSQGVVLRLSVTGKILSKETGTARALGAIACPVTTRCLMSGNKSGHGRIQLLTNGHIGTSKALPADTYVHSISCFGASLCYALGGNSQATPEVTSELFPLNPTTGAVGHVLKVTGFNGTGLTCISATRCLVVGFTGSGSTAKPGVVVVSNGSPGSPTDYAGEALDSVACATPSRCYAVGLGSTAAVVDKVSAG